MLDKRILQLTESDFTGNAVVYIMSRDQRTQDNHALLYAQELATQHGATLYVLFVLKAISGRSREHYEFMLGGLEEVASTLSDKNIQFVMRSGDWKNEVLVFASEVSAGALVFDFSPLSHPRNAIKSIAKTFKGSAAIVDTHNIIPVWVTSDKQEFAAHTIRRKVHAHLADFLVEPTALSEQTDKATPVSSMSFGEAKKYIQQIPACGISLDFAPGQRAAHAHLKTFIRDELGGYAQLRNDFSNDHQSNLSPYLHFGHMSSLRVALTVMNTVDAPPLLLREAKMAQAGDAPSDEDGMNALFEEMIVRKELSDNFCFYNSHYTSLDGAADWALTTLREHESDKRDHVYSRSEWEQAVTHDEAWNAAQHQLAKTGKLHGYLRMYWAKKLLEWSDSPADALATGIYLNDKYSIDGGDPNGYVGLLWSVAGLHDRPWTERPVFGKIRYMNAAGLKRKYDLDSYIETWGA